MLVLLLAAVGAENWSGSCDLGILVDQPAESIEPYDLCVDEWSGRGNGSQRWRLTEGAVRSVFVVVHHVPRQRHLDMSSTNDQHPVQQLTTDRADPSLGVGVRPWRPHRHAQRLDPWAAKTASNVAVNLASRSRSRNLNRSMRPASSMSRLRACWVTHIPVGLAVTPRMCTRRVASSITNSTYRRCSSTVSTWKKLAARIPWAWRQFLSARSARRGAVLAGCPLV
jgi:hypothetical protein